MSADIAIRVSELSKIYRLGQIGTGTLSHDLKRWWAITRGKEDPYLKIGAANDRTKKSDSDYSWVLRDINFDVKKGEVLGVIGSNGAGKSTLLKILSRVTSPTKGEIKVKGRIASLLEVGTGFHPEMTGKENIFMNGAILGMTKNEIRRKFDDIVEFAGIARYIDTPVKRYSSGMYVRLAFAVAAHLESEILIVDEVLAVGDMEFQKKCLSKMNDISHNDGRTVLFVSHNLPSVKSLCTKAISLQQGRVKMCGETGDVIADYLKRGDTVTQVKWAKRPESEVKNKTAYFTDVIFESHLENGIQMGDDIVLTVGVFLRESLPSTDIAFELFNSNEQLITTIFNPDFKYELGLKEGLNYVKIIIEKPNLLPDDYSLSLTLMYNYRTMIYDKIDDCVKFNIELADVTGYGVRPFMSDRGLLWFNTRYERVDGITA